MTFVPERSQLRGLSVDKAELYGKPHVGARYRYVSDPKSNRRDDGARCAVCGRPAESSHHVPPLSKGRSFVLETPIGSWRLLPSLFALCGSGTTGCHGLFHGGARYFPRWEWLTDEAAEAWWSGELLSRFGAHSPELYAFGRWVVSDAESGKTFGVGL